MEMNRVGSAATMLVVAVLLTACSAGPAQVQTAPPVAFNASATPTSTIAASAIEWTGFFGGLRAHPDVAYTLLGLGFLQAPTSDDIDSIVQKWIAKHPSATVIPVFDFSTEDAAGSEDKLIWVWLVDGESNLNLELVRQGACAAGTMAAANPAHILVSTGDYETFESKLDALEQLAKRDKLGIWK